MPRYKLPPVATGTTWSNVVQSLWTGRATADESEPELSNREALSIVMALRDDGRGALWPLWYQYAALAYGWSHDSDALNTTQLQANDQYEHANDLMAATTEVAAQLDAQHASSPRLELRDQWTDKVTQQLVSAALRQDGAEPEFKVPIPACKDPVTGKPARPVYDRINKKWVCPGGMVTIDDPITAILKSLAPVAVPLAIILIAAAAYKQTRRRKR